MATLRNHSNRIPPRTLRLVGAVAGFTVLVALALRSRSLLAPLGRLHHADSGWLVVGVLAETASLAAYALVVRKLLRGGNVRARLAVLLRATVGGIAMNSSLPGGQVVSAGYWYRQLRREGADRGLTAFALFGAMVAGALSLAGLLVGGIIVAGGQGPLAAARGPILVACAGIAALAVALRGRAAHAIEPLAARFLPGLPARCALERRRLLEIAALAFANWLLDCACLYAALSAVHAHVAPAGILLGYALAQLVANVPLLPGGGGTVEATLVLAFAGFHTSGTVLAGVLLYRVLCCWGLVPVGWLAVALEGRRIPLPRLRPAAAFAAS
jgi:uncharacterized membrane protein YbhN (UPF0104 family)